MSKWEEYKKKLGESRPWDLLKPAEYTGIDTAYERYKICLECPQFIRTTKQCRECGCFMVLKTKLEDAKCPLEKW
jgi:hypothetical protein